MPPDDDLFDILKAIKEQSATIARMQTQLEDLIREKLLSQKYIYTKIGKPVCKLVCPLLRIVTLSMIIYIGNLY